MRRLLTSIPILFCLAGCSEIETTVGTEEFSTVPLQQRKIPVSFDTTFSSPSRGRLALAYTAPAGVNGKKVWLLLFERSIPAKNRPVEARSEGYLGSQGPVTLLIVEPSHSDRKKGWSIINSIPLGIVSRGRKDYIALRWLEPAKEKGPVLIVSKLDGVDGSSELIAFPNGWEQLNPVRQTYGDWANLAEGSKYEFYSVDTNGFMCITENHSDYTNDHRSETTSTKYHYWDGTGWNTAANS